ncbi:hypothetical protein MBM_00503 [Drepanopeziza brunnea f. sp. 'multigermtubi' MB_m1]|uniref:Flo11 n=1 Tax=Marssonina brunnea f. sp. multigermtubi (strain MB_m1) TaxID=1072389 RepID=K1WUN4_MARBU|nr:uncharacterized protein MBM_00503 [Drepanopeziza brunnea f. sp. 'multigermtubi' MB_m1]EKD21390.1 hypothetical protein MBM_00503 [Drepanopeziza brunnea f. sp. 'multigermtubi' MB_m1]
MATANLTIVTDATLRAKSSPSFSSDGVSLGGRRGPTSPPSSITPPPAFIAASAASQIVTNDHDSHAEFWLEQHGNEPSGEPAIVAPPALSLVNMFLDQILFTVLSVSKSTSLASLRLAVAQVLKPKLAYGAIAGADQELHEYLGGGEEEELLAFHNGLDEPSGDWDLELVWKRTRLRCMVYSSLGDMEEEDEDYYAEREHLDGSPQDVVSPAVAIFMTSILEFMGEQVLVVAGQAAYHRLRIKIEKEKDELNPSAGIADRVVVEENDMERVALDRTIGRLWRGWKRRIRTPVSSVSMTHSISRESLRTLTENQAEIAVCGDAVEPDSLEPPLSAVCAEGKYAALVPLPMNDNDILEIEIPGLARQSDDEDGSSPSEDDEVLLPSRPKSMVIFTHGVQGPSASSSAQPERSASDRGSRKRSNSLPSALPLPFRLVKRHKPSVDVPAEDNHATKESQQDPGGAPEEPEDTSPESHAVKDVVDALRTGAVAIGATVMAGVVAAAHGEVPQTALAEPDEHELEETVTEEAQIMTSSRVSFRGRMTPEAGKEASSGRSSIRSVSGHSLRLIDVTSTRSQVSSRQGFDDAADLLGARPVVISRSSSFHSAVKYENQISRMDSPVSRCSNTSPITRNGSSLSSRRTRNSADDSISEVEEDHDPVSPTRIGLAVGGQSIDVEAMPSSDEYSSVASSDTRSVKENVSTSDGHSRSAPLSTVPYYQPGPPPAAEHQGSSRGPANYQPVPHPSHQQQHSPSKPQPRLTTDRSSPPRSSYMEHIISKGSPTHHTSRSGSSFGSQKLKPIRTSDDYGRRSGDTKGQSFEQLIQSDETIQYTLTPENMRAIEVGSPISFLDHRPTNGRSPSLSPGKPSAGFNSHPHVDIGKSSTSNKSALTPVSRLQTKAGTKLRPNAPQPRDARCERDSIGDFAEFIRSTGPANSYEHLPPTRAASTKRGTNSVPRNPGPTGPPRAGSATTMTQRSATSAGRSKLQARDAVIPRGETVSDLIDFVRSGPQLEKQDHRIPRTVAPFRDTLDSDHLVGAVGGKAVDATLPDLRFSQALSVSSSMTSQSALLGGSRNKPLPCHSPSNLDEEDSMPKRKTRRVRDPYSLDFSDEDDDDLLSRPAPIKEESLVDFLRNAPPPPPPKPVPEPVSARPRSSRTNKKPSSPSIMSRFGRNGSISGQISFIRPQGNDSASSPVTKSPITPLDANLSPISPSSYDQSRKGSYASQTDYTRNYTAAQMGNQSREAVNAIKPQSSDPTKLLRNDPLRSAQAQPKTFVPTLQKEEASTFQRIFGRKKSAH